MTDDPPDSESWVPLVDQSGPAPRWRVVAVSSSGGVLLDLLALRPWLRRHDVTWASVLASDTRAVLAGQTVRWMAESRAGSPLGFVWAIWTALRVLSEVEADVVVSAGTGIAVPFFVACRLRRVPSVWVETHNVIGSPGRAARICSWLASITLVQHSFLLTTRPRSVLVGELY